MNRGKIRGGRVQVYGCSPGCLLLSLGASATSVRFFSMSDSAVLDVLVEVAVAARSVRPSVLRFLIVLFVALVLILVARANAWRAPWGAGCASDDPTARPVDRGLRSGASGTSGQWSSLVPHPNSVN